MTVQELRYFTAVARLKHFGRAAAECHVSQPTLSGQLRKLEDYLGVALFERTNKRVTLTPAGERILVHAERALDEIRLLEHAAQSLCDPLAGPLKLGVIPTVAPYLMPRVLKPLRKACPKMPIELWEDTTQSLLARLASQQLDAILIATDEPGPNLESTALFDEPFLAVLPKTHPLADAHTIHEADLGADLLVLSDAHCLAAQSLAACGRPRNAHDSLQAASLETLVSLVAAGYGTTLAPALAAPAMSTRGVVVLPLHGEARRTIRIATRPAFPRKAAVQAVAAVIRTAAAAMLH